MHPEPPWPGDLDCGDHWKYPLVMTNIAIEHGHLMRFIVISWDFKIIQWNIDGIYLLVICYIAIENGHRNSGFNH